MLRNAFVPLIFAISNLAWAQAPKSVLEDEFLAVEKMAAKALLDRSVTDFAKLIADDAVFFHIGQTIKGKAAIVEFSRPMFAGPVAPFSYAVAEVSVLPSGLAMTSGPILTPDGNTVARYNTVWRKTGSEGWKIVFDRSWSASQ